MTSDSARLADLYAFESELLDHIAQLTIERDAYRLVAHQALAALHEAQLDRDVLAGQRILDRRRRT